MRAKMEQARDSAALLALFFDDAAKRAVNARAREHWFTRADEMRTAAMRLDNELTGWDPNTGTYRPTRRKSKSKGGG